MRVGVIAPALLVSGLRQREGAPLGRVSSAACRAWTAYSLSSEAPIPLPGNNPVMVPAAVAAIPCLPLPAVDPCTLPATPPSPRPGHPLHPMTAGHATDPKQGRDYRYRRPDRHCLRMGHSRPPGGAAKAVLSPSSAPPERPRPHSLALVPAARKAPASFSRRRARFWRRQRARSVTFCLWTVARIDSRVYRGSGFNLRDVFPTGCVEGRAEGAARSPGCGLRRGAELDRPRPQPVVDGVERFDQLVVPWIMRIE